MSMIRGLVAAGNQPSDGPAPGHDMQHPSIAVVRPGYEVRLRGRLDARTVGPVRELLHHCVDQGSGDLTIDVSAAAVVDASGLGLIVGVHRRARLLGRRMVLVGVPPRLERLISLTRLNHVIVRLPIDGSSQQT